MLMYLKHGPLRLSTLFVLYLTTYPRPSFQEQSSTSNKRAFLSTSFPSNAQDVLEQQAVQQPSLKCGEKVGHS